MQKITDEERRWHQEKINEHHILSAGSTITYGKEALKSIIIINGGAAVALLALVSQVAKGSHGIVPPLSIALVWFGGGVLAGALATGLAYLSQWANTYAIGGIVDGSMPDTVFAVITWVAFVLSLVLAAAGLGAFAWGGWTTADALQTFAWSSSCPSG